MRREFSIFGFVLLAAAAHSLIAETVDRAAITLGNQVITESEVVRSVRLAAFQNGLPPDFGAASRREAAQRLIDLKLVEREMDLGHYVRTSPQQARALLDSFTADHYRSSPEALRVALAVAKLTPADLEDELAEQADLLSFLNLRFRPAVAVSDQEIEQYFHDNIEPKTLANPVPLSEVRANIEQILAVQHADRDLDLWLADQRKRSRISVLIPELQ